MPFVSRFFAVAFAGSWISGAVSMLFTISIETPRIKSSPLPLIEESHDSLIGCRLPRLESQGSG